MQSVAITSLCSPAESCFAGSTTTYVPIVVPTPPSPRARELADLLTRVIEAYEEGHPTTSRAEIREATRLALAKTGPGSAGTRPIVAGSLAALTVGLVGVSAFLKNADGVPAIPWTLVAVGLLAIVFGIVAVARNR